MYQNVCTVGEKYIQFNKRVNSFQDDLLTRLYKVEE